MADESVEINYCTFFVDIFLLAPLAALTVLDDAFLDGKIFDETFFDGYEFTFDIIIT